VRLRYVLPVSRGGDAAARRRGESCSPPVFARPRERLAAPRARLGWLGRHSRARSADLCVWVRARSADFF